MKLTKNDKDMLRAEYMKTWRNDESADWSVKNASGIMELRGYVIVMCKPHITTEFCFGEHGYDYDEVVEHCSRMSKSEEYFISKNLGRFEAKQWLDMLDGDEWPYSGYVPSIKPCDYESDGCRLADIKWLRDWSEIDGNDMVLSDKEKMELRVFLEDEVAKFEKRLHTYLKRYGMSKCHFWTYWADR